MNIIEEMEKMKNTHLALEEAVYKRLVETGHIDSKENFMKWRKKHGADKRMPQRYALPKDLKKYKRHLQEKNIKPKGDKPT